MKHQVWDWIERRDVNLPNIPLFSFNAQKIYNERVCETCQAHINDYLGCKMQVLILYVSLVVRVSFWNVHNNLMCKMKVITNFATCKLWIDHACGELDPSLNNQNTWKSLI
jgi:hypothetical protein